MYTDTVRRWGLWIPLAVIFGIQLVLFGLARSRGGCVKNLLAIVLVGVQFIILALLAIAVFGEGT